MGSKSDEFNNGVEGSTLEANKCVTSTKSSNEKDTDSKGSSSAAKLTTPKRHRPIVHESSDEDDGKDSILNYYCLSLSLLFFSDAKT